MNHGLLYNQSTLMCHIVTTTNTTAISYCCATRTTKRIKIVAIARRQHKELALYAGCTDVLGSTNIFTATVIYEAHHIFKRWERSYTYCSFSLEYKSNAQNPERETPMFIDFFNCREKLMVVDLQEKETFATLQVSRSELKHTRQVAS